MRRLSAKAFEMSAATRTWAPDEATAAKAAVSVASSQDSATYRQAYLEGFDAGFADGDREARRALEEAQEEARKTADAARAESERWRDQFTALAEQFAEARKKLDSEMEALAVAIAYAAVCRIVGKLHAERSLVPALCRETVASLPVQATQVRVAEIEKGLLNGAGLALDIVADPALNVGDCVIVTELGEIEAGIGTQMQVLLQALLVALRDAESQA